MATYLVTGAAGFIGSHVAEALLEKGHDVISLDNLDGFYDTVIKERNIRDVRAHAGRLGRQFQDIRGDIRDSNLLKQLFELQPVEGVFHLAALAGVLPSIKMPHNYWSVNCTGTSQLIQEMQLQGIKRFVFASSSSVYGLENPVPYREDMDVSKPISPYGATKRSGELLCHTMSHLHGVHCACLRFFTVYGPRQRPDLAIHKFTRLIEQGQPIPFFGDGSSQRDYTYIEDIVDGVLKSMEHTLNHPFEIFNLGESRSVSLKQLIEMLEAALGKQAVINRLPSQPGDMTHTFADISKARELLGYAPKVSKEEGLARFVKWFRQVNAG